MLFLDGVYIDGADKLRFRHVKAPTNNELTYLTHTIAHRVARHLERQGLPPKPMNVPPRVGALRRAGTLVPIHYKTGNLHETFVTDQEWSP